MAKPGKYSMNDVVVYISSVANFQKHPRKVECLLAFAEGVQKFGHRVHIENKYEYVPSRLAVMLGWATTNTGGHNITLRKRIIREQLKRSLHTMCIDASCWKYLDNNSQYLRYSIGGPFYDHAEYANKNSTDSQWQRIQQDLGVEMKPYQNNAAGHVLVCMQRDGGFSMKTLNPIQWAEDKIKQITQLTSRPIVLRPHPGESKVLDFSRFKRYGVKVSDPLSTTLLQDLNGAHCAVYFNSSASVAALCAGIPVFVDDVSSVSWAVANKDITQIETPKVFDREQWIYDLAAAHWSDSDARQGLIYKKFLPFISNP
jgi:hypothetical protein